MTGYIKIEKFQDPHTPTKSGRITASFLLCFWWRWALDTRGFLRCAIIF